MEIYRSEEEQLQFIRTWWKKHGSKALMVLAMVLVVFFAGRYYFHHQQVKTQQASIQFDLLIDALVQQSNGEEVDLLMQANRITEDFNNTVYAQMTELLVAADNVAEGDNEKAKQHLYNIVNSKSGNDFYHLATTRLARLLIAAAEYEEALKVLNVKDTGAYTTLYEELRGDVYFQTAQYDKARKAYKAAAEATPIGARMRPLLQMKIDDIALKNEIGE